MWGQEKEEEEKEEEEQGNDEEKQNFHSKVDPVEFEEDLGDIAKRRMKLSFRASIII